MKSRCREMFEKWAVEKAVELNTARPSLDGSYDDRTWYYFDAGLELLWRHVWQEAYAYGKED